MFTEQDSSNHTQLNYYDSSDDISLDEDRKQEIRLEVLTAITEDDRDLIALLGNQTYQLLTDETLMQTNSWRSIN